jgi:hypothetical protein
MLFGLDSSGGLLVSVFVLVLESGIELWSFQHVVWTRFIWRPFGFSLCFGPLKREAEPEEHRNHCVTEYTYQHIPSDLETGIELWSFQHVV